MTTAIDTPRAGRREWIGLAVLALACLLYVMDVLEAARIAFVHGMQVAATISAIIAMTVAILAVVLLRDIRGAGHDAAADLSDNQGNGGDPLRPEPRGTVIPVPEC